MSKVSVLSNLSDLPLQVFDRKDSYSFILILKFFSLICNFRGNASIKRNNNL